jgi:parallel beta-helix repeat protein
MRTKVVKSLKRPPYIIRGPRMNRSLRRGLMVLVFAIAFLCLNTGLLWATDHSGNITSDTTWYAADSPHVIVGNVTVQAGVTLTLEPGVDVQFNSGRYISTYGTLTAVGTSGTGILFTKSGASDGNGLYFYNPGRGTFDYCTMEYCYYGISSSTTDTISVSHSTLQNGAYGVYSTASIISISNSTIQNYSYGVYATGGAVQLTSTTLAGNTSYGFYGSGVAPTLLDVNNVFENNGAGIYVQNVSGMSLTTAATIDNNTNVGIQFVSCTDCTLDNVTLTGNGGTSGAIYMGDTGEFGLGGGNTIGGGGQENSWPLTIGAGAYPSAGSTIPTSGNTNNDIQVAGGTSSKSGTWRKFTDLDYIVAGNPTFNGGLTIEDGVNVRFNANKYISIYGSLTAVGTPGTGILFTKSGASIGNGLYFYSSSRGTLDYCTMEYCTYGITSVSTDTISVSHSTLQNNSYGVYAQGGAISMSTSTLQNNTYGVYAPAGALSFMNSEVINNTSYGIYLSGGVPVSFGSDLSEWNDIYGNGPGSDGRDLYNDTLDTYAPYVYWGTINGFEIEAKIWDKVDDIALGKVCYAPWSNASHDWAIPTWLTIVLESGAKSSSGDMRLVWSEYCDTAGVDHYVIYRSTTAHAKGDSLAGTTDIEYLDAGVAGDVNTHYYYTVEVVDGVGNRLDSNQVGEFDRGLLAK